jgi:hypothetical protein
MPRSEASPTRLRAQRGAILLAIAGLAVALRFAGLGFGLSPPEAGPVLHPLARPDEQYLWNLGLGIAAGDPNPHFFLYPSLLPYLLALADAVYVAGASLAGGSREAVEAAILRDPRALIWIARGLVAAIGATTCLLLYRVAAEAFDRRVGLVAAFLLAVAHLHARDSHFGVTDVPLAAMTCLVLLQALRIESRGALRDYLRAGLCAGLAISTKYSGAMLLVPLVAAHAVARLAGAPRRLRRLLAAGALVPLGFLLGTPFALLDAPRFRDGLVAQLLAQSGPDWLGIELGPGWWHHLRFTLWVGLGPPLLAAAVVGAGLAPLRAPRAAAVLLSFAGAYYLVIGRGPLVFARYMVPLVPVLCATAALAVVAAAERLPRARLASAFALAALLALPSLRETIATNRVLARQDSRVAAARWLRSHLPQGATLLLSGAVFADPALFLEGRKAYDPYPWPPEAFAGRLALPPGPRFHRVRNGLDPSFDALAADPEIDVVVVAQSPLQAYGPTATLERRLPGFRQVASFEGVGSDPELRFDLQDAFYVPLGGAARAPRPGPNLLVYAREAPPR